MNRLPLLFLALAATGCSQQSAAPRPNIIVIVADDLGYGDLGVYGQTKSRTPRLDQVAREGMRFTRHYSGSTFSTPSRSVLMTGLHTGHTYVRGNKGSLVPTIETAPGDFPLADSMLTVAEILKSAGSQRAW